MHKVLWLAIYAAVLTWSAIAPKDYFTWLLEVLPALVGLLLGALSALALLARWHDRELGRLCACGTRAELSG